MNNSEIIGNNEDVQEQRVLGADAGEKFRLALKANKEFIEALIKIGKKVALCLPSAATKIGYKWAEISQEGLLLIKKLGNTLEIDCIPFDVLGIFAIQQNLDSLGIKLPSVNMPKLEFDIINKLLKYSTVDILGPMKEIFKEFDLKGCITNIKEFKNADYVINCLKGETTK